jgi:hypothetical protein
MFPPARAGRDLQRLIRFRSSCPPYATDNAMECSRKTLFSKRAPRSPKHAPTDTAAAVDALQRQGRVPLQMTGAASLLLCLCKNGSAALGLGSRPALSESRQGHLMVQRREAAALSRATVVTSAQRDRARRCVASCDADMSTDCPSSVPALFGPNSLMRRRGMSTLPGAEL